MHRQRPGIAKASSLPDELGEGGLGSTIVRSVLSDLDALITKRGGRDTGATFVWGTATEGGARLTCGSAPEDVESLRISWNNSEIVCIELETRSETSFSRMESPADPAELIPWLIPRVWAHIQGGGALPAGIDRFAPLF